MKLKILLTQNQKHFVYHLNCHLSFDPERWRNHWFLFGFCQCCSGHWELLNTYQFQAAQQWKDNSIHSEDSPQWCLSASQCNPVYLLNFCGTSPDQCTEPRIQHWIIQNNPGVRLSSQEEKMREIGRDGNIVAVVKSKRKLRERGLEYMAYP